MLWASSGFSVPNTLLLTLSGDITMTIDFCPLPFGEGLKILFCTLSSTSIGLSVPISSAPHPSNSSSLAQSEVWGSWVPPQTETDGFPVCAGGGVTAPGLHWSGRNPD